MGDFNDQLFTRVCTLEAQLELNNSRLYLTEKKLSEIEKLLREALFIIESGSVNGSSNTNGL